MRINIKEHVSSSGKNYDRYRVLESSSVTKTFKAGKWWIVIDGMAFEVEQKEADSIIKEAFQTGMLDLSNLIPFDLKSIFW